MSIDTSPPATPKTAPEPAVKSVSSAAPIDSKAEPKDNKPDPESAPDSTTPVATKPDTADSTASTSSSLPSIRDASVYISEIDQSVNEADLFRIFSAYGDILTIRVAKDPVSQRSLGYAYVNFKAPESATAALAYDFNFIHHKPCRVSSFQKDPTLRKTAPRSTVFVRNLEADTTKEALKARFAGYGTILDVKIALVPNHNSPYYNRNTGTVSKIVIDTDTQDESDSEEPESKPAPATTPAPPIAPAAASTEPRYLFAYGCLEFETPEQALAAIKGENSSVFGSRTIYTSHHVSRRNKNNSNNNSSSNGRQHNFHHLQQQHIIHHQQPQQQQLAEDTYTNLFVKNLDPSVTESEFVALFSKYGELASHSLPTDDFGVLRGFGFVNFLTHTDAVAATQALNDTLYKEKRLVVIRAMKRGEREDELRAQYDASKRGPGGFSKSLGGSPIVINNTTNLYIKYLDVSIDDDELQDIFSKFGTITSARIMMDESGQSRGFGFVCYAQPSEAQAAIAEMHNAEVKGKTLYVTIAQRRDKSNHHNYHNNHHHHHHHHHQQQSPRVLQQSPFTAAPFYSPYYLAAAAAAAAGMPPPMPNYAPAGPWGGPNGAGSSPNASVNGSSSGPQGGSDSPVAGSNGPSGPPALMFTPYSPYPGMPMHMSPNMNYRKMNNRNNNVPQPSSPQQSQQVGGNSPQLRPLNGNRKPQNSYNGNGNRVYHQNNNYRGGQYNNARFVPLASASSALSPNLAAAQDSSSQSSQSASTSGSSSPALPSTATAVASAPAPAAQPSASSSSSGEYRSSSTLSAALASAANSDAERQVIGEALYPKVQRHAAVRNNTELTAKLTGMMLDIATEELLKWIDDDVVLSARIQDAYDQYMEFLAAKEEDPKE